MNGKGKRPEMNQGMITGSGMLRVRILVCLLAILGFAGARPIGVHAEQDVEPYLYVGDEVVDVVAGGVVHCGDGTAVYDAATGTLTLTNATIERGANEDGSAIRANRDLTLELVGNNSFEDDRRDSIGIHIVNGDVRIIGSGSLTMQVGETCILSDKDIVIDGGAVNLTTTGNGSGALYASGDITIRNHARVMIGARYAGILSRADLLIDDSDIISHCKYGSAIYADGSLMIRNSTAETSTWDDYISIAIYGLDSIVMDHSTVTAASGVGAIYSKGTITVDTSRVTASCTDVSFAEEPARAISAEQGIVVTGLSEIAASGGKRRAAIGGDLTVIPVDGGMAECKVGTSSDEAANVGGTPFVMEMIYSRDDQVLQSLYVYIRSYWADVPAEPTEPDVPEVPEIPGAPEATNEATAMEGNEDIESICHHQYEWERYRLATATTDGIMRYRCRHCGDVAYTVPVAAYYVFNKETQEAIRNAAVNETVTVSTPVFISFHEMVRDALLDRQDVTLVVDYENGGNDYEMIVPSGSGDRLRKVFGESQYAGFLHMSSEFVTVQR